MRSGDNHNFVAVVVMLYACGDSSTLSGDYQLVVTTANDSGCLAIVTYFCRLSVTDDCQSLWQTETLLSVLFTVLSFLLPCACLFLFLLISVNGLINMLQNHLKCVKVFKVCQSVSSRTSRGWLSGEGCLTPSPPCTHEFQIQNLDLMVSKTKWRL